MSNASQTALENYITKRGGDLGQFYRRLEGPLPDHTLIRVLSWLVILGFTAYFLMPRSPAPIQVTYELDLEKAPVGNLVVTLIAEGDLPRHLDLEFPPGVFGDAMNGVTPHSASANELNPDGSQGKELDIEKTQDGWRIGTGGAKRAGFIYQVDLNQIQSLEGDVRRHISTPVAGGLRMAGFEVFLQPIGREIADITVTIHNPNNLKVLVPWPALIRSNNLAQKLPDRKIPQQANISQGQGYLPAADVTPPNGADPGQAPTTHPVPQSLLFHPKNLADLNNSLLVCGDLKVVTAQVRECVIQLASDQTWAFPLDTALNMIRRIARTEMAFFGSAPTAQITVILAANRITAEERFDVYGVHTGSSVLVMMDTQTTYRDLEAQTASVIAHEMFHGWLGEAIPQLDPTMLWFTEGATTWYAARMLTASGIWTPDHGRAVLEARLEQDYKRSPLRSRISLAAAASEVMADPAQVRFSYAGGVSACVNLDQWLTQLTGRKRPLDLVLRHLYDNRDGSPLTRQALEKAVFEVTGVDCGSWLDENVYQKTTLPTPIRLI